MEGNPFGAPPPSPYSQQTFGQPPLPNNNNNNTMAGNPFDPMAAAGQPVAAMQQQQAGVYGVHPQQQPPPSYGGYGKDAPMGGVGGGDNPFGAPPLTATPAGHYGQPLPQQHHHQHQAGGYPPMYQQMGAPAAVSYDGAMVPSTQPSNPYAVAVHDNPFGQQIVAAAHQTNQWAISAPPAAAATFDPFAAPPAVTPPQHHQQQQQQYQQDVYPMQDDIFGEEIPQAPEPPASPPAAASREATSPLDDDSPYDNTSRPDPPPHEDDDDDDYRSDPPSSPRIHQNQYGHSSSENQYAASGGGETMAETQRNRYSQELSRRAPPGASPLPKAELVRKKGFVLSRISFRTIVMKKWKQSFWVQYGPHTMLWFRSQSDFDDWLNNPYHTQSQRNFLIKLAVNFVHDLYKPSVRGYQVTQCRTKAYGAKMIRQFKLERWMDYGPTIAAAFGSYNPKEVDDLREALVECMRNTPLNGGIRATGAVRQPNPHSSDRDHHQQRQHQHQQHHHHDTTDADNYGMHTHPPPEDRKQKQQTQQQQQQPDLIGGDDVVASGDTGPDEVAEKDLLDMNDWDASAVPAGGGSPLHGQQQQQHLQQQPVGYAPQHAAVYAAPRPQHVVGGYPPQHQQQPGYPPHQQQQQQADYGNNAMVPVGGPQTYPGAMYPPQETAGASTPGWLQQPQY